MSNETQPFDNFNVDDWWDPRGRQAALHRITPLRFEYFSGVITETLGGLSAKRVLDVGCGGGLLSERFAQVGAVVTGIDRSIASIKAAKEHARTSVDKGPSMADDDARLAAIDYLVASPEELSRSSRALYDVVVCSEVLEHVDDLEGFVAATTAFVKQGGLFVFSTINKTLKARVLAIFMAERIARIIEPGTHQFSRLIKPSTLTSLLRKNRVKVREIKGLSFDPLRFEFVLSGDTSINYLGYGIKES